MPDKTRRVLTRAPARPKLDALIAKHRRPEPIDPKVIAEREGFSRLIKRYVKIIDRAAKDSDHVSPMGYAAGYTRTYLEAIDYDIRAGRHLEERET